MTFKAFDTIFGDIFDKLMERFLQGGAWQDKVPGQHNRFRADDHVGVVEALWSRSAVRDREICVEKCPTCAQACNRPTRVREAKPSGLGVEQER